MIVDTIAFIAFFFVLYRTYKESSKKEKRVTGAVIFLATVYCATQWNQWSNTCVEPITGTIQTCGPWDGHPRIIISLAIILISSWVSTTILKTKK